MFERQFRLLWFKTSIRSQCLCVNTYSTHTRYLFVCELADVLTSVLTIVVVGMLPWKDKKKQQNHIIGERRAKRRG